MRPAKWVLVKKIRKTREWERTKGSRGGIEKGYGNKTQA